MIRRTKRPGTSWRRRSPPRTGAATADVERLLGAARARHEQRREWAAVAKLLELEIAFASGTAVEAPMQAELARVYQDELVDADRAKRPPTSGS